MLIGASQCALTSQQFYVVTSDHSMSHFRFTGRVYSVAVDSL